LKIEIISKLQIILLDVKNCDIKTLKKIIFISICSTHHTLAKYAKIFEKFYLIIRDLALVIVSELYMEFGKNCFCFVCKFIYHATFFRNKKYYFV
jgi:hypothetical protein